LDPQRSPFTEGCYWKEDASLLGIFKNTELDPWGFADGCSAEGMFLGFTVGLLCCGWWLFMDIHLRGNGFP
jgi:hypothetical protein